MRGRVLCRLDDLADGCSRGALPDQRGHDQVILVCKGDAVFAYLNVCPRYGQSKLGWKKDRFLNSDGSAIMCASHGALFRINDGYCELGPCLGQSLTPVAVQVLDESIVLEDDAIPIGK